MARSVEACQISATWRIEFFKGEILCVLFLKSFARFFAL